MTPEFITAFFMDSIKTAILLASPMLLVGLFTGVLVSMFQAATQINEMTLVFVPKMLGVALALSLIHISEPTRPRRQSRMPSSA